MREIESTGGAGWNTDRLGPLSKEVLSAVGLWMIVLATAPRRRLSSDGVRASDLIEPVDPPIRAFRADLN